MPRETSGLLGSRRRRRGGLSSPSWSDMTVELLSHEMNAIHGVLDESLFLTMSSLCKSDDEERASELVRSLTGGC